VSVKVHMGNIYGSMPAFAGSLYFVSIVQIFCSVPATAIEINGLVHDTHGDSIVIVSSSEYLPNVGDKVEVSAQISEIDDLAHIASGKVDAIQGELIFAKVDRSDALEYGLIVSITSENPRNKAEVLNAYHEKLFEDLKIPEVPDPYPPSTNAE